MTAPPVPPALLGIAHGIYCACMDAPVFKMAASARVFGRQAVHAQRMPMRTSMQTCKQMSICMGTCHGCQGASFGEPLLTDDDATSAAISPQSARNQPQSSTLEIDVDKAVIARHRARLLMAPPVTPRAEVLVPATSRAEVEQQVRPCVFLCTCPCAGLYGMSMRASVQMSGRMVDTHSCRLERWWPTIWRRSRGL